MQDNFAIGPVSIVQLVGLASKPRIASAQVDAAVRAADISPHVSAHVGIAKDLQDLQDNVGEVSVSYFDIKAPQMLSLSTAPMRASISFEAGVDRAVADSSGPQPGLPQSFFDGLSQNTDLASLLATLRGGSTPINLPNPAAGDETAPAIVPILPNAESVSDSSIVAPGTVAPGTVAPGDEVVANDSSGSGVIFDGADSFGDDEILNFEAYYEDAGLFAAEPHFAIAEVHAEMVTEMQEFFAAGLGSFYTIDAASGLLPEPTRFDPHEFVAPQHQVAAIDAILPI